MAHDRAAEEPAGLPAGAGPVWSTGLTFDPDGGTEPIWSSLPPALAVLPEVAIARSEGRSYLTVCAVAGADTDVAGRLASLRAAPLTPPDPHPSASTSIAGRHPPERYEEIVAERGRAAYARVGWTRWYWHAS